MESDHSQNLYNIQKKYISVQNLDIFFHKYSKIKKGRLLEKIYFYLCILDVPNATKENTLDEVLIQIKDLDGIDYSSINWDIMDD